MGRKEHYKTTIHFHEQILKSVKTVKTLTNVEKSYATKQIISTCVNWKL